MKAVVSDVWRAGGRSPLEVKWVPLNNIHLTMVFLGNLLKERVSAVEKVVETVCQRFAPFGVHLNALGFFGNRRHPRVLWLGLDGDVSGMGRLRNDLQKNLKPFGIKPEKRHFKPHLTLGRFRKNARGGESLDRMLNRYGELKGPDCPLKELVLFKSDLTPRGAIYTRLNKWTLGEK